jgi:hypothetical protein
MNKFVYYLLAIGVYTLLAPVQLDAQALPESRKLLNIIVQNSDSPDGMEESSLGKSSEKRVTAGPKCHEACSTVYEKCLTKGMDLGTFVSAPKSVVKRICTDEALICNLECQMGYHVSLE